MESFHNVLSSLLTVLLSFTLGCGKDTPPGPVAVSGGINTIKDLIESKCKEGFALVVLPGQNPHIQQGMLMPDEGPPIQGDPGRDKIFASDKFFSCDEKRKIRFVSLTYEISAVRIYPPDKKEPLPLFSGGKLIIEAISITDPSPRVGVKPEPLSTTNRAQLVITLGADGAPMQRKTRTITLRGRFKTTPELKADQYFTRLKNVEAVDENAPIGVRNKPLKFAILEEDNYEIQVSSY